MVRILICALVLLLLASCTAWAATVTLTCDELSADLDGVTVKGVTFGFTGGDAMYGTLSGPGPVAGYFDPRNIEGSTAGTLTMTFAQATTSLEFCGAMDKAVQSINPAFYVQLWGLGEQLIGNYTMGVTKQPNDGEFPVGKFTYSGTLVGRVVVTFNTTIECPRFAIDNVKYDGTYVVPEPSTFLPLLCGLAGITSLAWRRRR